MLSIIAKGFFASSPLLFYPILALVLFLALFTVLTVRVLRSDKSTLNDAAALPLADDMGPQVEGAFQGARHE